MRLRIDLLHRTHPKPDRLRTVGYPGYLLYPGYVDLQGTVTFYGPEEFIGALVEEFDAARSDSEALENLLSVRVQREVPKQASVELPHPGRGMELRLPPDDGLFKSATACEYRFRIPVVLGEVWTEARYVLYMGKVYAQRGVRKTIGTGPVHFEVKELVKATGDEINLLTCAWLGYPRGIAGQLVRRGEYSWRQVFNRVLEVDPRDAWAKYHLAEWARSVMGQPALTAKMYASILTDVRAGVSHRLIALLDPHRALRPVPAPQTTREWEALVEQRSKAAEAWAAHSERVKKEVHELARTKGYQALLGVVRSDQSENLWLKPDVWPAIYAIRHLGAERVRDAHEVLVQELRKLLRRSPFAVNGLCEREIVNALCEIHGLDREIDPYAMLSPEDAHLFTWWLERPKPEDVLRDR